MMLAAFLLLFGGVLLFVPKQAGAAFAPITDIFAGASSASAAVDPHDLDILARTLWGEARGEGRDGMQAVANVIMNRFTQAQGSTAKARQFGGTVAEICQKPYQFSIWNVNDPNYYKIMAVTMQDSAFRDALGIAEKALIGRLPDLTDGADHYHTAAVNPNWSKGQMPIAVIGVHEFYKLA